jgi:hypothetical protein
MSKPVGHSDKDCCCKKEKEEGTKVLLKCGTPTYTPLPAIVIPPITDSVTSIEVASLELDTSKFCNPCIKFDFTCNIIVPVDLILSLTFQIYRECKNKTRVGSAFIFSQTIEVLDASTFSFFVCDCDACSDGCCTYTVEATPNITIQLGSSITNATLSALVVENDHRHC